MLQEALEITQQKAKDLLKKGQETKQAISEQIHNEQMKHNIEELKH
jgi:hypothetical protein